MLKILVSDTHLLNLTKDIIFAFYINKKLTLAPSLNQWMSF